MSEKLYIEQNLVHNENSFKKTIQVFVECINSILSDIEQPGKEDRLKVGRNPFERMVKMLEYMF